MHRILVINPGSTSTKLAVFDDAEAVFECTISHEMGCLARFESIDDQFPWRRDLVLGELSRRRFGLTSFAAVVGRGGRLRPVKSGTIAINDAMLADARSCLHGQHASNLGCLIANAIARPLGLPSFVVDPVSVDEMWPLAKVTGLPEVKRTSLSHALNMKAVARKAARHLGLRYEDSDFIVAHLGGGSSVSAHRRGLMVDLLNSDVEGPFSVERAGAIPSWELIKICFAEGASADSVWSCLSGSGGLYAHLKTKDAREIERRIREGDAEAERIYSAMAYAIAKGIGSMAAVLSGQVDAVIFTGGLAHSTTLIDEIQDRVAFLAPVLIYPGGHEMEALALGALRVLRGEESPQEYA